MMDVLLLILILLICPTFFALKAKFQYGGLFSKNSGWNFGSSIALIILVTYIIFISVIGKAALFSLCDYACRYRYSYFYEPSLLVIPSIGYGFIMYPYIGSEYFKAHNAIHMFNMGWLISFIGWVILIGLFLILVMP